MAPGELDPCGGRSSIKQVQEKSLMGHNRTMLIKDEMTEVASVGDHG